MLNRFSDSFIEDFSRKEFGKYVLLLALKDGGIKIWCRDGNVSLFANLCKDNVCGYKKLKREVITGIYKCKRYQITDNCGDWYYAKHIFPKIER